MSDSCDPMDCSPPTCPSLTGFSVHGIFPGNNTGTDCHFLLQGVFPSQRSNLGLLHCRQSPYQLSHQGSSTFSESSRITDAGKPKPLFRKSQDGVCDLISYKSIPTWHQKDATDTRQCQTQRDWRSLQARQQTHWFPWGSSDGASEVCFLITSVLSSEWWDWGSEHWLRVPLENFHTLLGISLGSHCFWLYSNQISCPGSQWDSVSFIIPSEKPLSFFSNFNFLIEGWLLYNVVSNSAVQQHESIIIIYMVATVHGVAKSWTWLSD